MPANREHLTLLRPSHTPLAAAYMSFLLAKEAQRCTEKTLEHYQYTVGGFVAWLGAQAVPSVTAITPTHIRTYIVALQRRGVKDTTQHAHARGIKCWLRWLVREGDLDHSPMEVVAMPRLEQRVPPPFTREQVRALVAGCDKATPIGARNHAAILVLLDTGLRAAEFCSLHCGDVDMRSGATMVMGKGRKQRQLRVGSKARSGIVRMLSWRDWQAGDPLWVSYDHEVPVRPLTVHGLQVMLHRLGWRVGVLPCGPHRFRRTFALWCLRDGMDLESLRLLMGHSSLAVLERYLLLDGSDAARAHKAHSPVDNLL